MKTLIINPNSDREMTNTIKRTADSFADGEFEIEFTSTQEKKGGTIQNIKFPFSFDILFHLL